MHKPAIQPLIATLTAEKHALQQGTFDQLEILAQTKQQHFDALEGATLSASDLRLIQSSLSRNEELFAAAIAGVRAAQSRIHALRTVRAGLTIYDRSGAKAVLPNQHCKVEKKA